MFGKLFAKKQPERFPQESFTISQGEIQGMPVFAMINLAYKRYGFGADYPYHLELEFDLAEKTDAGLTTRDEANVLNEAEDLLIEEFQKASIALHFIVRQTWNGKRIIDAYVDKKEGAESVLNACIAKNAFKRACTFKLMHDPDWNAANAFLQHF